jgi:hypothetical protein
MAKKRGDSSALPISEVQVTIKGTSPLVLLPLGAFKGQHLTDDQDRVEESLKLYRRHDKRAGFPAGGIKRAVQESMKGLDLETRRSVESGMHIVGEDETNMVVLEGEHHGESFDFDFKKPKRTVTLKLPVLDQWRATFLVQFIGQSISRKHVEKFLGDAGKKVGLGHRRPERGTFEVENIVSVN